MRANFWAAKFISLVLFEQLNSPNAVRTMVIHDRSEARRRAIERLVPGRRAQRRPAAIAHHRLGQTCQSRHLEPV